MLPALFFSPLWALDTLRGGREKNADMEMAFSPAVFSTQTAFFFPRTASSWTRHKRLPIG